MAQRNDELSGMAAALAFIGAAVMIAALFLFAIAAFAALIFTILALFAWNKPRRIGRLTLEPRAARAFVIRGIAGAFLIPAFAVFCSVLFDFQIEDQFWPYLILGGYVLGSIGIEILLEDEIEGFGNLEEPQQQVEPLPPPNEWAPPKVPFRYASWDDEEKR